MKLRVLLVGLIAAMLSVSAAVASPQGKPPTTGAGCKPKVTVVLKGSLTSVTPLRVDVTSANRWGRAYVAGTLSTEIAVDTNTKVRRQGEKSIADLVIGDRVLVQARVCKAALVAEGAKPDLTAVRVVAHPVTA